jgi:hypothetical protein
MFKQLVHDSSASASAIQQVVDDRVAEAGPDPEIILNETARWSHHLKTSGTSCRSIWMKE